MQLIRLIEQRWNKSGKRRVLWGLFKCPDSYCGQEVEKRVYQGLRDKSCGCQWHSEEHGKKISHSNKGKKMSEEAVEKTRQSKIGKKHTEEHNQKIRESLIGKNIGKVQTEETRQKISNSLKGKFVGNKNGNWINGSSFEPYPPEFNKQKKQVILKRDMYMCQTPNCMNTENLCIHHIDYDKKNNNEENLTTLCNSCHSKTVGKSNRHYWIKYYSQLRILYL